MQELPKQLLAWLGRLLPKQEVTGDSNVQVGRVGGNIRVTRNHQHGAVQADRIDVTVINHHHHHTQNRAAPRATPEQKAVLQLMDNVQDRIAVLDFMEREFKTRMVIELDGKQLYRLKRYVEVVIQSTAPCKK
ncbi:hypothetical protein KIH07_02900 [Hydrogenophaga taeniospiralis]|uniref:hypothetical protein n=1 Tax=Hydrogenophaga taeniospiralis TaxID=65656 RepID=UPI001CFA3A16|nr:hypothetical protein [Hydrogenophaga taeniospiralis]MCB4362667.1 hypothetical protein [Hydrogenophaga taeniospiralis]